MKLARLKAPGPDAKATLDRLLVQHEVESLQLESPPPSAGDSDPVALQTTEIWKSIHRAMYLRPELKVFVHSIGSEVLPFTEQLASLLSECGSPQLPIAVVRGTNLLPDLAQAIPAGCDLNTELATSAQVEIGAEPLSRAIADGARVIIVGACDITAPFIAAASGSGLLNTSDLSMAGPLAAASHFEGVWVQLLPDGRVELEPSATESIDRIRKFKEIKHADFTCDYRSIALKEDNSGRRIIEDLIISPGDNTWNVRIALAHGMEALVIVEASCDLHAHREFCASKYPAEKVSVKEYVSCDPATATPQKIYRLGYQGNTTTECQAFIDALEWWLERRCGVNTRPLHAVRQITETANVRVPADSVVLSVDTRPAREWI